VMSQTTQSFGRRDQELGSVPSAFVYAFGDEELDQGWGDELQELCIFFSVEGNQRVIYQTGPKGDIMASGF
jgi:hypothetical protein